MLGRVVRGEVILLSQASTTRGVGPCGDEPMGLGCLIEEDG